MELLRVLLVAVLCLAAWSIGRAQAPKAVDLPLTTARRRRRRRPKPQEILAKLTGYIPVDAPRKNPIPCLLCGNDIEHCRGASEDGFVSNHPVGGLAFETQGHYGSAFFDPGHGGIKLEIAVHDNCLRTHKDRMRVVTYQTQPTVYQVREGDPEV